MHTIRNRITALILVLSLLIGYDCLFICRNDISSYAAETDSSKILTVYTEPSSPKVGSTVITETGLGLDTLVKPANAARYRITWKSSNEDIATVDSTGHVHGTLTGMYDKAEEAVCTITATVSLAGRTSSDSVKVKVKRSHYPMAVFLNGSVSSELTMTVGEYSTAKISCAPQGCRTEFYFLSSDPDVAFIDDYGYIYARSQGTAVISVHAINGATAKCTVHVSSKASDTASGPSPDFDPSGNELIVCYDGKAANKEIRQELSDLNADCEAIVAADNNTKTVLASCGEETDAGDVMEELGTSDKVLYVQPNYRYTLDADDPYYQDYDASNSNAPNQYFHFTAGINKAWQLLEDDSSTGTIKVGVIDSGVDASHPDLKDNLILDDNGRYKYFSNGLAYSTDTDTISHGTHVTGIIGAVYGNGLLGCGAASGPDNSYAKVIPAGIISEDVNGGQQLNTFDIIRAIDHAVSQGARIINMSFCSEFRDRLLGTTIKKHFDNGVIFVGSAGNDQSDLSDPDHIYDFHHPSDMKEVISVCNINRSGNKNSMSNYGYAKDISAPGTSIYSTLPSNGFGSKSGTSMSAPVISSVCALVLRANPDLTPSEVRNIICASADTRSGYYEERGIGYGAVNAEAAVAAAIASREAPDESILDELSIKIKLPYGSQTDIPESPRYSVTIDRYDTYSVGRVSSYKVSAAKRKVKVSFGKAGMTKKTRKVTTTKNMTSGETNTSTTYSTISSKAKVRYQIALKPKGGKPKYYKTAAVKRTAKKFSVSVKGSRVTVTIRKYGTGKLKKGKKYLASVRAYQIINGKTIYGKWTKFKAVKVR